MLSTTGIRGLDEILNGGLPSHRLYLVQGAPGVGKTTLGLQFLLDGAAKKEKSLYVTLSETKTEIAAVAKSHGWALDGLELIELSAMEQLTGAGGENSIFHPADVELGELMGPLLDAVARLNPRRVVFDSLSEIRLLAQGPLHYRKQILSLKQFFAGRECTVLLLDDLTASAADMQLQSLAHGVLELDQLPQSFGSERRRIRVAKLRGRKFRGGYHDYKIETGGMVVFPRLVAADHTVDPPRPTLSSGLEPLDALLGGGLDGGTSTLFTGPAGTGKSSVMAHYAAAAARQGLKPIVFAFDENREILLKRSKSMGLDLESPLKSGELVIRQVDPAELAPDELTEHIRRAVDVEGRRFVAIDSLNGYLHAMPDEKFLTLQLHETLSYLARKKVVAVMVLAQAGMLGGTMTSPVDVSYIADTVVSLRFFEARGTVRKAISVIKKRSSAHESTIRELTMTAAGMRVGEPLVGFQGVLKGTPSFIGDQKALEK